METMQTSTGSGTAVNSLGRKKILLPNDLDLFLELKRTFHNREDLDMLSTGSGAEAYAMTKHYRPDLVFLDLKMKEMDGDECCREIKHNPELNSTPVTMIIDSLRPDLLKRCRDSGCDNILSKPFDPEQLSETVRRYQCGTVRTALRVDARLRVRFGQKQNLLTSYSVNLSTGGLFLEMAEPLPAETPLDLEFDLPDQGPLVSCRGRVAWVNPPDRSRKKQFPPGMGIQFLNLTMEDMDKIRDFVKRQSISPAW